jgi:hypothetical protein
MFLHFSSCSGPLDNPENIPLLLCNSCVFLGLSNRLQQLEQKMNNNTTTHEMSNIGIRFCKRWYIFPKFGRFHFQTLVNAFIPVTFVRLVFNFNKLLVVRKFAIIILASIFRVSPINIILFPNMVSQYVRKPLREFGLPNETLGNC